MTYSIQQRVNMVIEDIFHVDPRAFVKDTPLVILGICDFEVFFLKVALEHELGTDVNVYGSFTTLRELYEAVIEGMGR